MHAHQVRACDPRHGSGLPPASSSFLLTCLFRRKTSKPLTSQPFARPSFPHLHASLSLSRASTEADTYLSIAKVATNAEDDGNEYTYLAQEKVTVQTNKWLNLTYQIYDGFHTCWFETHKTTYNVTAFNRAFKAGAVGLQTNK